MTTRSRRLTGVALAVYLLGVARVTLWPEPAPDDTFDIVRAVLDWLEAHGIPLSYAGLESAANVVMFVPFGILVGLLLPRRPPWTVIALGAGTSVAIELAQLAFLPSRVSDPRDVVANTLGAAVGVGLLRLWTARTTTAVEVPAP